jgi:hypothetical protein
MTVTAAPPAAAATPAAGASRSGRRLGWRWLRLAIPFLVLLASWGFTLVAHADQTPDPSDPRTLSPRSDYRFGASILAQRLAAHGTSIVVVHHSADALAQLSTMDDATLFVPAPDFTAPELGARLLSLPGPVRVVLVEPGDQTLAQQSYSFEPAGQRWATGAADPGCPTQEAVRAGRAEVRLRLYSVVTGGTVCYQGGLAGYQAGAVELFAVGATDPFRNDRIDEVGNSALAVGLLGTPTLVWLDLHTREPDLPTPVTPGPVTPGGGPTAGVVPGTGPDSGAPASGGPGQSGTGPSGSGSSGTGSSGTGSSGTGQSGTGSSGTGQSGTGPGGSGQGQGPTGQSGTGQGQSGTAPAGSGTGQGSGPPTVTNPTTVPNGQTNYDNGLKAPTFFGLLPPLFWVVLVALAIVALLLAIARAQRLGPPVSEPIPVLVPAEETVVGRGRLYHRAGARAATLTALRAAAIRRLRRAVDRTAGDDPDLTLDPGFVEAVAARAGTDPEAVRTVLHGHSPKHDRDLIEAVEDLDTLMAAVQTTAAEPTTEE